MHAQHIIEMECGHCAYVKSCQDRCAHLCEVHEACPKSLHLLYSCDSAECNLPKALCMEGAVGNSPKYLCIEFQASAVHHHTSTEGLSSVLRAPTSWDPALEVCSITQSRSQPVNLPPCCRKRKIMKVKDFFQGFQERGLIRNAPCLPF